jgi:hypothetical protein
MAEKILMRSITLDASQQCFENAIDSAGCRQCPNSAPLEQQFHLEHLLVIGEEIEVDEQVELVIQS